ncbi:MAG: ABC transporter ATP-binding protein [Amylibacter sp.]|nr:ABC transporter ATP-binding protein [Amylibacter sp.]
MIKVSNLQAGYGAVRAVRGVSLTLGKGELVTVLGANGAGKSSLMLTIAGALKPTGGQVFFDGKDVTGATPERMVRLGLAMVPETRDVFPDLTVAENLRLGAYIRRKQVDAVQADLEKMYEIFPRLKEREHQAGGTLSGGEQQMLVIARAMMSDPKVLLLDEPSLGLAPNLVDQIFEMILELKATGLSILLVEQNASKALQIADRAYVLRLGEIAAEGTAAEISEASDLHAMYLGG